MSIQSNWEIDSAKLYKWAEEIQSSFNQIKAKNDFPRFKDKHFEYCKILIEIYEIEDSLAEALLSSALIEE
jgi:hypothetical protein